MSVIGYSDTVVGFKRLSKRPLEYNSVFSSKELALTYVANDPTAYEGQVISVSEGRDEGIYMVVKDTNNVLKLMTVIVIGDSGFYPLDEVPNTITIAHGMNKYPQVNVIDSDMNQVYVDVTYDDLNNLTLTWNGVLSGRVYLT